MSDNSSQFIKNTTGSKVSSNASSENQHIISDHSVLISIGTFLSLPTDEMQLQLSGIFERIEKKKLENSKLPEVYNYTLIFLDKIIQNIQSQDPQGLQNHTKLIEQSIRTWVHIFHNHFNTILNYNLTPLLVFPQKICKLINISFTTCGNFNLKLLNSIHTIFNVIFSKLHFLSDELFNDIPHEAAPTEQYAFLYTSSFSTCEKLENNSSQASVEYVITLFNIFSSNDLLLSLLQLCESSLNECSSKYSQCVTFIDRLNNFFSYFSNFAPFYTPLFLVEVLNPLKEIVLKATKNYFNFLQDCETSKLGSFFENIEKSILELSKIFPVSISHEKVKYFFSTQKITLSKSTNLEAICELTRKSFLCQFDKVKWNYLSELFTNQPSMSLLNLALTLLIREIESVSKNSKSQAHSRLHRGLNENHAGQHGHPHEDVDSILSTKEEIFSRSKMFAIWMKDSQLLENILKSNFIRNSSVISKLEYIIKFMSLSDTLGVSFFEFIWQLQWSDRNEDIFSNITPLLCVFSSFSSTELHHHMCHRFISHWDNTFNQELQCRKKTQERLLMILQKLAFPEDELESYFSSITLMTEINAKFDESRYSRKGAILCLLWYVATYSKDLPKLIRDAAFQLHLSVIEAIGVLLSHHSELVEYCSFKLKWLKMSLFRLKSTPCCESTVKYFKSLLDSTYSVNEDQHASENQVNCQSYDFCLYESQENDVSCELTELLTRNTILLKLYKSMDSVNLFIDAISQISLKCCQSVNGSSSSRVQSPFSSASKMENNNSAGSEPNEVTHLSWMPNDDRFSLQNLKATAFLTSYSSSFVREAFFIIHLYLELLNFYLMDSFKLTHAQIFSLWDSMVCTGSCKSLQTLCCSWFSQMMNEDQLTTDEVALDLFLQRIVKINISGIGSSGFEVFQTFFIFINYKSDSVGNLSKINDTQQKISSDDKNPNLSCSSVCDKINNFIGITELWNIYFKSFGSEYLPRIAKFIIDMYNGSMNRSTETDSQLESINLSKSFVDLIFDKILSTMESYGCGDVTFNLSEISVEKLDKMSCLVFLLHLFLLHLTHSLSYSHIYDLMSQESSSEREIDFCSFISHAVNCSGNNLVPLECIIKMNGEAVKPKIRKHQSTSITGMYSGKDFWDVNEKISRSSPSDSVPFSDKDGIATSESDCLSISFQVNRSISQATLRDLVSRGSLRSLKANEYDLIPHSGGFDRNHHDTELQRVIEVPKVVVYHNNDWLNIQNDLTTIEQMCSHNRIEIVVDVHTPLHSNYYHQEMRFASITGVCAVAPIVQAIQTYDEVFDYLSSKYLKVLLLMTNLSLTSASSNTQLCGMLLSIINQLPSYNNFAVYLSSMTTSTDEIERISDPSLFDRDIKPFFIDSNGVFTYYHFYNLQCLFSLMFPQVELIYGNDTWQQVFVFSSPIVSVLAEIVMLLRNCKDSIHVIMQAFLAHFLCMLTVIFVILKDPSLLPSSESSPHHSSSIDSCEKSTIDPRNELKGFIKSLPNVSEICSLLVSNQSFFPLQQLSHQNIIDIRDVSYQVIWSFINDNLPDLQFVTSVDSIFEILAKAQPFRYNSASSDDISTIMNSQAYVAKQNAVRHLYYLSNAIILSIIIPSIKCGDSETSTQSYTTTILSPKINWNMFLSATLVACPSKHMRILTCDHFLFILVTLECLPNVSVDICCHLLMELAQCLDLLISYSRFWQEYVTLLIQLFRFLSIHNYSFPGSLEIKSKCVKSLMQITEQCQNWDSLYYLSDYQDTSLSIIHRLLNCILLFNQVLIYQLNTFTRNVSSPFVDDWQISEMNSEADQKKLKIILHFLLGDVLFQSSQRYYLLNKNCEINKMKTIFNSPEIISEIDLTQLRRVVTDFIEFIVSTSHSLTFELVTFIKSRLIDGCSNHLNAWNHTTTDVLDSIVNPQFVGLGNASSTCYINSVLQQLYMIPEFRNSILSIDLDKLNKCIETYPEPAKNKASSKRSYLLLLRELQKVFGFLSKGICEFFYPRFLWEVIWMNGELINVNEQHDALELCHFILDYVDEGMKLMELPPIGSVVMGGVFSDQKICKGCPHRYSSESPFLTISLDIKNRADLIESLKDYVKGDVLEGSNAYYCYQCDCKVDTLKRMCIKRAPPLLAIQLKRFDFDWEVNQPVKFNDYFEFPIDLDIYPFTEAGLQEIESHSTIGNVGAVGESEQSNVDCIMDATSVESNIYTYRLVGVLVHLGRANFGHYYSYILDRNSGKRHIWYKFDDSKITECPNMEDTNEMKCSWFGENDTSSYSGNLFKQKRPWSAYLLFYERTDLFNSRSQSEVSLFPAEFQTLKDHNLEINQAIVSDEISRLVAADGLVNRKAQELTHISFHLLMFKFIKVFIKKFENHATTCLELKEALKTRIIQAYAKRGDTRVAEISEMLNLIINYLLKVAYRFNSGMESLSISQSLAFVIRWNPMFLIHYPPPYSLIVEFFENCFYSEAIQSFFQILREWILSLNDFLVLTPAGTDLDNISIAKDHMISLLKLIFCRIHSSFLRGQSIPLQWITLLNDQNSTSLQFSDPIFKIPCGSHVTSNYISFVDYFQASGVPAHELLFLSGIIRLFYEICLKYQVELSPNLSQSHSAAFSFDISTAFKSEVCTMTSIICRCAASMNLSSHTLRASSGFDDSTSGNSNPHSNSVFEYFSPFPFIEEIIYSDKSYRFIKMVTFQLISGLEYAPFGNNSNITIEDSYHLNFLKFICWNHKQISMKVINILIQSLSEIYEKLYEIDFSTVFTNPSHSHLLAMAQNCESLLTEVIHGITDFLSSARLQAAYVVNDVGESRSNISNSQFGATSDIFCNYSLVSLLMIGIKRFLDSNSINRVLKPFLHQINVFVALLENYPSALRVVLENDHLMVLISEVIARLTVLKNTFSQKMDMAPTSYYNTTNISQVELSNMKVLSRKLLRLVNVVSTSESSSNMDVMIHLNDESDDHKSHLVVSDHASISSDSCDLSPSGIISPLLSDDSDCDIPCEINICGDCNVSCSPPDPIRKHTRHNEISQDFNRSQHPRIDETSNIDGNSNVSKTPIKGNMKRNS